MPFPGLDSSPNGGVDSCLKHGYPWFDHQPRKFPWLILVLTMQPYECEMMNVLRICSVICWRCFKIYDWIFFLFFSSRSFFCWWEKQPRKVLEETYEISRVFHLKSFLEIFKRKIFKKFFKWKLQSKSKNFPKQSTHKFRYENWEKDNTPN